MRRTLFSFVTLVSLLPTTLPAQRRLPAPASVFGFEPGADNRLATYDQVVGYFKQVDAASDHVRLVEAGTSTQGRTYYFALVRRGSTSSASTATVRSRAGWRIPKA